MGVYVNRLVDELLRSDGEDGYFLLISRFAGPPARWQGAELIRPPLPVGPLYAAWNFCGIPPLRHRLDVVHATGLVIPPAGRAALVATVHDLAVEQMPEVVPPLWRRIYLKGLRRAVREAAVICAVSAATRQALIDCYGVDKERVLVTPEAPNVSAGSPRLDTVFQRLGLSEPYVLNVGTVEPRKNQLRLLKAFATGGNGLEEHTLVLAGSGGWGQDEVLEEIERLKISHRVVLTGRVTTPELASLYSRAAVFALPSLYEGFGLPLIEALSFGLPTVTSTTPALEELAGPAAILVDPFDIEGLSRTLGRLAHDEDLRTQLSEAGRGRAARYTWKATAAATRQAYAAAAGS